MRKIIVGSRQSALALTQTNWVIDKLRSLGLPFTFEVKKIVTKGDKILNVTLSKVGGKGLFVKEIEQAMLDGEIDMAVHSMKDMPGQLPEGLIIGCVPKRVDVRDVLISKDGMKLDELPAGAIVGTSSLRRAAQLKARRDDLVIKPIRGNIDSRIRKLKEEDFCAIILAAAGLERMQWKGEVTEYLPIDVSLPAVGQGALGIECRDNDKDVLDLLSRLNDAATSFAVRAERSFLNTLEGSCQVPLAAYAEAQGENVRLKGLVAEGDGSVILKETLEGSDPEQVGRSLANRLKERGAADILRRAREENAE
jgi:hydroxymethylbilane synthase